MRRAGHTEAGIDLAKLAGLNPIAVIAELVEDDGSIRKYESSYRFARENNLKFISITKLEKCTNYQMEICFTLSNLLLGRVVLTALIFINILT